MQSVFEAAGGPDGLRRLAHAWHVRVTADEGVSHADDVPAGLAIPRCSWDGLRA